MTRTILITGAEAIVVPVDPSSDGAEGVNDVEVLVCPRSDELEIDEDDILTQADEANPLDPVG
jgi:hypothetical protein